MDSCQATRASTTEQSHEHGFKLVVCVVSCDDDVAAVAFCKFGKCEVSSLAGVSLDVPGLVLHADTGMDERKSGEFSQLTGCSKVCPGFCQWAQVVLDVGNDQR